MPTGLALGKLGFDGIYVAYLTGSVSTSFALLMFLQGRIAGADAGGAVYEGEFHYSSDGQSVEGVVLMTGPADVPLIMGGELTTDRSMRIPFLLPTQIDQTRVYRIETPNGPVNAKFRKLRSLP